MASDISKSLDFSLVEFDFTDQLNCTNLPDTITSVDTITDSNNDNVAVGTSRLTFLQNIYLQAGNGICKLFFQDFSYEVKEIYTNLINSLMQGDVTNFTSLVTSELFGLWYKIITLDQCTYYLLFSFLFCAYFLHFMVRSAYYAYTRIFQRRVIDLEPGKDRYRNNKTKTYWFIGVNITLVLLLRTPPPFWGAWLQKSERIRRATR